MTLTIVISVPACRNFGLTEEGKKASSSENQVYTREKERKGELSGKVEMIYFA